MDFATDISLAGLEGHQFFWIVAANTLLHELGAPLPMTPTALMVGAQAASGAVDPSVPIAAIIAATLIGNSIWFAAGRRYGAGVLNYLGRFAATAFLSEKSFRRWGGSSLLMGRFLPMVSLVAPPLAGAFGMRWTTFLTLTTASAALYGLVVVAAGMLLHEQIGFALRQLQDSGSVVLAAGAAALMMYIAWRWRDAIRMRLAAAAAVMFPRVTAI
jgi:membrane protein DedA with SNARE-associated domain